MANITFVDAGAGVETVTNGAALQPACPATVNANDILIAHVSYKGTSTGPATPSGWEPLFGPSDVGTTVAARHWIFGKIAVGNEDGTTVSFGTAGGTTHRYARIYRLSGWVSGTITQIVTGFTSIAHATDPQGPSVTTTVVGARAVAAMTQSDDNAVGAIAGASGGTWSEAVAEYLPALGTGASLILDTCVPTANPGTVSGGAIAATNDPSGTIGFEIRSNPPDQAITPAAVTVTATPGSLVVTPPPQDVTPAAVTVTAAPGSLTISPDQFVTPAVVTVSVAPGSLGVAREEQVALSPATVTVAPGSVEISQPALDQDVTPEPVSVSMVPGTVTVLPDLAVAATAPTVTVAPGVVVVEIPPVVDPAGAEVAVSPGSLVVLPVRKTKWMARMEEVRWRAEMKSKRRRA